MSDKHGNGRNNDVDAYNGENDIQLHDLHGECLYNKAIREKVAVVEHKKFVSDDQSYSYGVHGR